MAPEATTVDPESLETPQEIASETYGLNRAPFASPAKLATAKELVGIIGVERERCLAVLEAR